KGEVAHEAVHEEHGCLEAVLVLEAVSDRLFDPCPHLAFGRMAVAEGRGLSQGLAAAQTCFEEIGVPAAGLPGLGFHCVPNGFTAQGLERDNAGFSSTPALDHA